MRGVQVPVRGRDEADSELAGQRRDLRLLRRVGRVAEKGLGAADETGSRGESEEARKVPVSLSEYLCKVVVD